MRLSPFAPPTNLAGCPSLLLGPSIIASALLASALVALAAVAACLGVGLTGEQIGASNVIVLYTQHNRTDIVEDSLGSTAIDVVLSGSGDAQVVRDGKIYDVRWEQREPGALIRYYDADGEEFPLRPGKTWIEIVPLDYEVTFE